MGFAALAGGAQIPTCSGVTASVEDSCVGTTSPVSESTGQFEKATDEVGWGLAIERG
jgi:hypothetical protein